MKAAFQGMLVLVCLSLLPALAEGYYCDACGGPLGEHVLLFDDRIDHTRKQLCEECGLLSTVCYRCGVPAYRDYLELGDGRVLCKRDADGVVLEESHALKVCHDAVRTLNRIFGRFTAFPDENVTVQMIDRIDVLALYRVPGHDFTCPNLMGCIQTRTNEQGIVHDIRLLTGQTSGSLRAVTAHEYAHAWVGENVSPERARAVHPIAVEGFCELLAYLVTVAHGDEQAKREILSNAYTRGQVDLFIEAERRYGFNDILDWMKYGVDGLLTADDLVAVRDVELPSVRKSLNPADVLFLPTQAAPVPETLVLRGLIHNPKAPLAMINDLTLGVGEQGNVRIGVTNAVIRCVSIQTNSVLIEHVTSGRREELRLKPASVPK